MVQVNKRRPRSPAHAAKVSRPIDSLLNPEVFKALSDPTRLKLLACVAKCGRACAVGEVALCCSVDLSVVSRHLAALADAGVLESSKTGRTVSYRVKFTEMAAMFRALAEALEDCGPECSSDCGCGCTGGTCGKPK